MPRSALPTERMLYAISDHSSQLASAALGRFDAPVPSCPDWTVADLVQHLTEVHWFWTTIATELADTPPAKDDPRRPTRIDEPAAALARFTGGAARLVQVLAAADQRAECWTWAATDQTVGFITRHQVQEAAVHHWDVANAVGSALAIAEDLAQDAITEFLSVSVATVDDNAPDGAPDLAGSFRLRAIDTGTIWSIHAGNEPATVAFEAIPGSPGDSVADQGEIVGTASDLLLWLYNRGTLDASTVDAALLRTFRALVFTD